MDDFFTSTLFISQTITTSAQEGKWTAFIIRKNLSHHLALALAEHFGIFLEGIYFGQKKGDSRVHR